MEDLLQENTRRAARQYTEDGADQPALMPESMPGALRIDKAAHELMNFKPVKAYKIEEYETFYHDEHLYSVRHIENGMASLVYARSPREAVNMVRNGGIG